MKLLAILVLACGTAAVAQQYTELTESMKTAQKASDTLAKLESKTGPRAVGAAERLGAIYEEMIGFWRQRNAADAVKWSEAGKTAAVELAGAAHAGQADKAEAALKRLNDTCQSCHEKHREQAGEGKYRIKPAPDPTAAKKPS